MTAQILCFLKYLVHQALGAVLRCVELEQAAENTASKSVTSKLRRKTFQFICHKAAAIPCQLSHDLLCHVVRMRRHQRLADMASEFACQLGCFAGLRTLERQLDEAATHRMAGQVPNMIFQQHQGSRDLLRVSLQLLLQIFVRSRVEDFRHWVPHSTHGNRTGAGPGLRCGGLREGPLRGALPPEPPRGAGAQLGEALVVLSLRGSVGRRWQLSRSGTMFIFTAGAASDARCMERFQDRGHLHVRVHDLLGHRRPQSHLRSELLRLAHHRRLRRRIWELASRN
mmetsp:Transcript_119041/g.167330  ORF Transcript_119041/g.167330 Transcript_119041/m.167330 type:complete len:283 (-) Transcript_119041:109-957(-)